jgi:DNA repair exonuclease SbcCD nuclease subunit
MKFAHLADCHLGSWKNPKLQQLNMESFNFAIDKCIQEKVDFVLIAGDLFDAAIPPIDILKEATAKLKELKDNEISCFVVAGSHDFSVSGRSMIHVLEKAGLCYDVAGSGPIETENYFISGIAGEKKGLEIKKIFSINEKDKKIKDKKKLKILILHTTLEEMNLPFIDSISIKDLPKGFDYYALGHIHRKAVFDEKDSKIVYPGALFPCNFSEFEQNKFGYFFIVNFNKKEGNKKIMEIKEIPVKLKEVIVFNIDANNENPQSLKQKIIEKINEDINDKIVTLRISGTLASGRPSEINFKEIENEFLKAGIGGWAYCLLTNTSKLVTKEFELAAEKIKNLKMENLDIFSLEKDIIEEMIKQKVIESKDENRVVELMKYFDSEKLEGETNDSFALRLTNEVIKKLKLNFVENEKTN